MQHSCIIPKEHCIIPKEHCIIPKEYCKAREANKVRRDGADTLEADYVRNICVGNAPLVHYNVCVGKPLSVVYNEVKLGHNNG